MESHIVENVLEGLAKQPYMKDGDYIGEDGLLHCGKCHTRREKEMNWFGTGTRKVAIMCKCEAEALEARKEQERKEEEMNNIRRAKISSMMDDTFQTARFENYRKNQSNEKHFKSAMNYCQEFKTMYEKNQGLLFYGSVGTGKSYTAACIANYLLDHNKTVVMTSFVRLLQEIQGSMDREKREREEAFINKLNSVSLLIIDDLGAERSTDYALEKVYGIIDNRYRVKKPLILTTNLTLRQMQESKDIRYERIYDRIFEMCYPMEFTGVSWRKREAAQRYEETRKILEG